MNNTQGKKEMTKTEQVANFIRGQFEGVIDDQWTDVEDQTIALLQDRFDFTLDEAETVLRRYFHPFVKFYV